MDSRVAELQQVIVKKDRMILLLQKQLAAYRERHGELDVAVLEALQREEERELDEHQRRRLSSNAAEVVVSNPPPHPSHPSTTTSNTNSNCSSSGTIAATTPGAALSVPGATPSTTSCSTSTAATAPPPHVPPAPSPTRTPTPTPTSMAPHRRPSSVSPTGLISTIGKNVVLDYVEDSPMFRRHLEGFEESLGGLRGLLREILGRTKEYVAAGLRYGDEESALAQEIVHRKYARALFTTSCPELGSLSSIFNDVHDTMTQIQSSRVSMLLSIEAVLHHALSRFAENELKEAGELRKEVARLADEYESQLGKLLGKSKQAMGSSSNALMLSDPTHILGANVGSGSGNGNGSGNSGGITGSTNGHRALPLEREVMQARLRFELARFDLVRYLNRLDSHKKFILIECFNSTLYAFLGHFHACHELIKSVESGLRQRQETLQQSKREFEEDERMWTAQREALEARLKMDADGEIRGRSASLDLPVEIISEDTQLGRETFGGVAKQGYLFVRNSMFPARSWKRRWFQIHSGKLYQNKTKHMDLSLVCDLLLSRVRECTSSNLPFCFEIIDASQAKHLLQATSEADMNDWIEAARKSTESMLEKQSHRMVVHPEQQRMIDELVTENPCCSDCGQTPSEWVSINIGCFLCIECSGIHRSLGVHVSKVRSLTLDSWELTLLQLLRDHLGNKVVNSVWEHSIPPGWSRPNPTSPRDEKTKWIKAKYHFHGLAEASKLQEGELSRRFWTAARDGSIRELMWCLAHGVDVNVANDNLETALHLSASTGSTFACEYLVLNGASLVHADIQGRLPYDAAKASGHEALKLALMQKMNLEQYQF